MNSTIKTLFAFVIVLAGVFTVSCSKDNATVKEFTATMEEYTGQDSKTTLYNGFLYWQQGDQIKVYGRGGSCGIYTGGNAGGVTTFSLTSGDPGSGTYKAIYPASVGNADGTIELPDVQMTNDGSLTGFPMFATSYNSDLNFLHLCGVLRIRLQKSGVCVSSIEITSDVELAGRHTITFSEGVPTLTYSNIDATNTNPHKSVLLVCNTPQDISSPKDFYMYLPEHSYTALCIRIYSSDGGVCVKTLSSGAIDINRGVITTLTMSSSLSFSTTAGRLNGLFSVSSTKQVYFSQGNLQYTPLGTHNTANGSMPGIWRFAPNQFDYVGNANTRISERYGGWIDLFGWGTSGWNSGANCYQPWSISQSSPDYYPGGLENSSLTGDYCEADWAYHNAISNGGNAVHQWRTLSDEEWGYIIGNHVPLGGSYKPSRTNASNLSGMGNINGVGGLIILPDNWTLPSGCTFVSGISSGSSWNNNSYTLAQWAEMEAAGAVFLPAAGYRSDRVRGVSVFEIGDVGSYWLIDRYSNNQAYDIYFKNSNTNSNYIQNRINLGCGCSVRAVQDYN